MPLTDLQCPYVGLRPFREADYPFFFGRERDIRVISSNLLAKPLTILYGPSGVGKSSVLQAGVVPNVRKIPNTAVLYCNEWQDASYMERLVARLREAEGGTAASGVVDILSQTEKRFILILDQFEEFLRYHPAGGDGEPLDAALARIVNRSEIPAKVLIGIREDALSQFDQRFAIRIANLLGNTLALTHLRPEAARSAVTKPIEELNRRIAGRAIRIEIESALVDEVVRQVQRDPESLSDAQGAGAVASPGEKIETAYLQLVLRRLWDEELRQGSSTLRLATLMERIGGARQIVRSHVETVMRDMPDEAHREIAARIFRYLVTPSRTKIAQAKSDLVSYAEAGEAEVGTVLALLTDTPDARILRRLVSPERYEIFHDVLAQPILDWRRGYLEAKQRAAREEERRIEAERQQKELDQAHMLATAESERAEAQRRAARTFQRLAIALGVVMLAALALAWHAWRLSVQARAALALAETERAKAALAESRARAAAAAVEEQRLRAEAALAGHVGESEKARKLRAEADGQRKQADEIRAGAKRQAEAFARTQASLSDEQKQALSQIEMLRSQLEAAQDSLDTANREIGRLKNQLAPQTSSTRLITYGTRVGAGTICCLVRGGDRSYFLSTADAIGSVAGSAIRTRPGGHLRPEVIGTLTRSALVRGPRVSIAALAPGVEFQHSLQPGMAIRGVEPNPKVSEPVHVYIDGIADTGYVVQSNTSVQIGTGGAGSIAASGMIRTTKISRSGDSGAAVLNRDNQLIGIIYAGQVDATIVIPIVPILQALGVELVTTTPAAAK